MLTIRLYIFNRPGLWLIQIWTFICLTNDLQKDRKVKASYMGKDLKRGPTFARRKESNEKICSNLE